MLAYCQHIVTHEFGPQLLPNAKAFRTGSFIDDGQRVLHYQRATTNSSDHALWLGPEKVVVTVRKLLWDMEGYSHYQGTKNDFPGLFGSLTIIYLIDAGHVASLQCVKESPALPVRLQHHWDAFCWYVRRAWRKRKVVTVVNATSLNDPIENLWIRRPSEEEPAEQENTVDSLRRRAIANVSPDFMQPGPVCPVHFVTWEECRAHVGEGQYAIDVGNGWLPQTYSIYSI